VFPIISTCTETATKLVYYLQATCIYVCNRAVDKLRYNTISQYKYLLPIIIFASFVGLKMISNV